MSLPERITLPPGAEDEELPDEPFLLEAVLENGLIVWRRLGVEPEPINRWHYRPQVGDAELCQEKPFSPLQRDEPDDTQARSEEEVDLPETNWEHLQALSQSREKRLQLALDALERADSLEKLRILARWARKQAYCGIQRAKGRIRCPRTGKKLGEGLDYKRYALLQNAIAREAAKRLQTTLDQLPPPFVVLPIRDFPKVPKAEPEPDALPRAQHSLGIAGEDLARGWEEASFPDGSREGKLWSSFLNQPWKPSKPLSPPRLHWRMPWIDVIRWLKYEID